MTQINHDSVTQAMPTTVLSSADTAQPAQTDVQPVAAANPTAAETATVPVDAAASGQDELSAAPAQSAAEDGSYTEFNFPAGLNINQDLLGEFKDVAKGLGLNQAQAQVLADLGVKQAQAIVQAQQSVLETQKASWLAAVKADKEIGGDKLAENLAVAARAVQAFVSPELKALFDSTGLGNHPDMVRAFYKAGKLISEDSLLPGGTKPAGAGKSLAQALYPNQG